MIYEPLPNERFYLVCVHKVIFKFGYEAIGIAACHLCTHTYPSYLEAVCTIKLEIVLYEHKFHKLDERRVGGFYIVIHVIPS